MKNDGGPAFPFHQIYGKVILGMSLRDWFAGQALHGLMVLGYAEDWQPPADRVSRVAYIYADAMLKEREKA